MQPIFYLSRSQSRPLSVWWHHSGFIRLYSGRDLDWDRWQLGSMELYRGVHTAQRQITRQIPIESCTLVLGLDTVSLMTPKMQEAYHLPWSKYWLCCSVSRGRGRVYPHPVLMTGWKGGTSIQSSWGVPPRKGPGIEVRYLPPAGKDIGPAEVLWDGEGVPPPRVWTDRQTCVSKHYFPSYLVHGW